MTADSRDLELDSELVTVARNLYDALLEARTHVDGRAQALDDAGATSSAHLVRETLDKVDGALAEAGDVLERVAS